LIPYLFSEELRKFSVMSFVRVKVWFMALFVSSATLTVHPSQREQEKASAVFGLNETRFRKIKTDVVMVEISFLFFFILIYLKRLKTSKIYVPY